MSRRLDQYLVDTGRVATRARARDLILRGLVTIDGKVARPALKVSGNEAISIDEAAARYVSRAAQKLVAGLGAFGFDPAGRCCLDLGASTGGFVEVLLERGAAHIIAVDVGRDQLHGRLAQDARVSVHEQTDARAVGEVVGDRDVAAVTADLSFISLTKAAAPALALAVTGSWFVGLIKPQFEVGPQSVGKGGIVRDEDARQRAVDEVSGWVGRQPGWRVVGVVASPVVGGDGNQEWLIGAVRDGGS